MKTLFRLFNILTIAYGLSNIHTHEEICKKRAHNQKYHLTTMGALLTLLTEIMAIFGLKLTPHFITIAFIIEFFITLSFWLLLLISQDNLRTKSSKNEIIKNNFLKEIGIHFLPFACLAWEHLNFTVRYRRMHLVIINIFIFLYHCLLAFYYNKHKTHLYPVLNKVGKWAKLGLSAISIIIVNGFAFVLKNRLK